MARHKNKLHFEISLRNINNAVLCLLYSLFLYVRPFVRAVAERSVRGLFAIAQPIVLSLRNNETYGFKRYLEKNVFVRAVAERLVLAPSTEAPRISLAGFKMYPERLFVVYHPGSSLIISTVYIF